MFLLNVIPLGTGGVSDYAHLLAEQWTKAGLDVETVQVGNEDMFRAAFDRQLRGQVVIVVHLSIYGFAKRGLCWWVVRAMRSLKRNAPEVRVVVIFHELYAVGPPWRSAFWTLLPQMIIVMKLAAIADYLVTNTSVHERRLRALCAGRDVLRIPVFSNVGEPAVRRPAAIRVNRIVLFGSLATRTIAVRRARDFLSWNTLEIIEAGPGAPILPVAANHRHVGVLGTTVLSRLLSDSLYGLCWSKPEELAKSGVFAGYAAHGCVPIVLAGGHSEQDLLVGKHFILSRTLSRSRVDCDGIGSRAFDWYQGHRASVHSSKIVDLISQ